MNKNTQLQALEKVPHRSDPKKEKRDRTIRIRSFNYDRLAKLGDLSEDFDVAITKVLDYWEEHHKND